MSCDSDLPPDGDPVAPRAHGDHEEEWREVAEMMEASARFLASGNGAESRMEKLGALAVSGVVDAASTLHRKIT